MSDLRTAAQQALEAYDAHEPLAVVMEELRAALVEPVQERNFCPRCGKRTNDIHTCTPPQEEHFCDTHCTWADHAPGCVRAEPVQEPVPSAWRYKDTARICDNSDKRMTAPPGWVPLYSAPPRCLNCNDQDDLK